MKQFIRVHSYYSDESASGKLRGLLVDKYLSHPKPQIKKVLPFVVGMVATRLFV